MRLDPQARRQPCFGNPARTQTPKSARPPVIIPGAVAF